MLLTEKLTDYSEIS